MILVVLVVIIGIIIYVTNKGDSDKLVKSQACEKRQLSKNVRKRTSNCFRCKTIVASTKDDTCAKCDWIICSKCRACSYKCNRTEQDVLPQKKPTVTSTSPASLVLQEYKQLCAQFSDKISKNEKMAGPILVAAVKWHEKNLGHIGAFATLCKEMETYSRSKEEQYLLVLAKNSKKVPAEREPFFNVIEHNGDIRSKYFWVHAMSYLPDVYEDKQGFALGPSSSFSDDYDIDYPEYHDESCFYDPPKYDEGDGDGAPY